jgi:hypothetical protein
MHPLTLYKIFILAYCVMLSSVCSGTRVSLPWRRVGTASTLHSLICYRFFTLKCFQQFHIMIVNVFYSLYIRHLQLTCHAQDNYYNVNVRFRSLLHQSDASIAAPTSGRSATVLKVSYIMSCRIHNKWFIASDCVWYRRPINSCSWSFKAVFVLSCEKRAWFIWVTHYFV